MFRLQRLLICAVILGLGFPLVAQSAETGAQISQRVLELCDELMEMVNEADISEESREALRKELNRSKMQYLAENHCTALDILGEFLRLTDGLRENGSSMHAEMLRNHGWMTRMALQQTIPPSPCYEPRLGMQPETELLQSSVEGLTARFNYGLPMLITREGDGQMWTEMMIPGLFPRFDEFGRPAVPYFTRLFAVPMGAELRMTARPQYGQMLPMNLWPFQDQAAMHEHTPDDYAGELPPESVFDDPPFEADEEFYAEDMSYPEEPCMMSMVGTFRDLQIAEVSCAAGQYNPAQDEFMPFENVRVDIFFEGGQRVFMTQRRMEPFDHSPGLDVASVMNFETALEHVSNVLVPLGCLGEELLILTHPDLLSEAQRLAQHKRNSLGIMTNVMIVNDGDGPGPDGTLEIHLTIAARYLDCAVRPSYLLAFGDVEYVPTFYVPNPVKAGVIASDYPYSLADPLEQADIMNMDFGVGRLPVDPEQAEAVVDKIIQYELNPPQFQEPGFGFYSSISIASQFECCRLDSNLPDGTDQRTFIQTVEDVRNRLLALGYGVERIYEESVDPNYTGDPTPLYLIDGATSLPFDLLPPFPWDGSRADVVNAINDGRFLVIHLDHGGSWGWGHPKFDGNDASALNNEDRLPFILGYNCSSGYVDNETDQDHDTIDHPDDYVPFTERLIRNPNGGVIGTIAATRTTFAHGNIMIKGALDSAFPSMDPNFGANTMRRRFGDMLNHGRLYMLHRYGASNDTQRHAFLYNLYGDPTTRLWTQKPQQLPRVPELIEEFPGFIDIQYEVEGAIITAYQLTDDLRPIGRAMVEDGHAIVNHFIEPIAGVAIQYQASMPGAVGTTLEVPAGSGSEEGCLGLPVELAWVWLPLLAWRMRRLH